MEAGARILALEARARRRRHVLWIFGFGLLCLCIALAAQLADTSLVRLIDGFPRIEGFFAQALPHLSAEHLLGDVRTQGSLSYWFYDIGKWLGLIATSINMALMATFLGVLAGWPLSFLAARNLSLSPALSLLVRRLLDLLRALPDLVVALVLVLALGVGPLAGVLAIAIHTSGALGKLIAEANENAPQQVREAMIAAGAGWVMQMRYAIVPQTLPNVVSYLLIRLEINVAAAAAIGFVGAGGIGQEFMAALSLGLLPDALAILVLIVGLIMAIDMTSQAVRRRLAGDRA